MSDQNGCKVRSRFNIDGNADYVSPVTNGLTCDPKGYARGEGQVSLVRSDGALIMRSGKVYLNQGFVFTKPLEFVKLVGTDGKRNDFMKIFSPFDGDEVITMLRPKIDN